MEYLSPFFTSDDAGVVRCEGGRLMLPSDEAMRAYVCEFCSNVNGWRRCTVARAVLRHYEAVEAAEDDARRGPLLA